MSQTPDIPIERLDQICRTIASQMGCQISIMMADGEVVASSIPGRQGTYHEGAARVLSGELDSLEVTAAMAAASGVMLEGCNLGLDLDGQRLLNVAVAAPLEYARRYASIVKICVEAMLKNELDHQATQQLLRQEIDERKAIEAKLMASEARFRDFAETAAHWLWEMDSELRFSYFSARLKTYLGLDPELILGKSRRDLMDPDHFKPHWKEHLAVLERHEPFSDFEYDAQLPNGETRIFRSSGHPVFDSHGSFQGYRGVGRDVTEEITHRRLAKQLRKRLDDAMEAITEGLLLFDHNHRLVICNSAFRRAAPGVAHLLQPGLAFSELNRALLETGMIDIPPAQWDSWLAERWQQYLNCDKQLLFPIQGQRWIEVNQYRTQDGGTLIIRRDITERINAEQQIRTSEERLRAITDHLPSAIYLKDAEGRMLLVSKSYRDFYCDGEDPTGKRVEEFLTPAMAAQAIEHDQEAINAHAPIKRVHQSDTLKGKRFIVHQTKFPVFDSQGELIGVGGIDIDITAEVESEERQRQAATVFENTQEGIIITDAKLAIIAVNPAFTQLTGYSEQEVLGQRPSILQSGKHDAEFYAEMWRHLADSGQWCGEIWSQRKGGEIYPEWLSISEVRSDSGELLNYVAVFSDISAAKESEQQLEYLAHHDPLTELPNRLLFMSRLHHALQRARRDSSCMALLFVDLDHFKHINDSLGHAAGDQLLLEVAHRLTSSVREEDTVARLGGDEFTLLLEGLREPKDVEPVLTKLLQRLRRPFTIEGQRLHITGSIGVSLAPQDGNDETTLLRNADTALYKAKERGRNAYQFYTTEFTLQAQRRIELEQQLRDGLEQQQFIVYYQPQIDMEHGFLIGAEALVRWQHPERGIIAPDQFISLAEETGLIRPLGQWVLEQACQQMKHWQQCGYPIETIAVNFSREELTGGEFVQQIAGVLARTDLKANHLEMEIVESLIMEQSHEVMEALDRLRLMGISLAIDDFGTGYSSLAYLKQLPVTTLKIDRSFVRDIVVEPNDAAIVQAVLAMTDSLQLFAIAEGVETAEQARFLRRHGCRQAQGYYFGRPMPAEQFEQLFAHCGEDGKVHLPIICVKE